MALDLGQFINLDPEALEDRDTRSSKINIDLGRQNTPAPDYMVEGKATRYDTALAEASPGIESLRGYLYNGNQQTLDELLYNKKLGEFEQAKVAMVNDLIKSGEPLSDQDKQFILQMSQTDYDEVQSKDTLLETEYAKKFLNNVIAQDQFNLYTTAMNEDPEETQQIIDRYEKDTANQQVLLRLEEDLAMAREEQSWGGAAWDFAEDLVPLSNMRMKGYTPESEGTGTGDNLKTTFDYLRSLPTTEEFNAEVSRIYFDLKSRNLNLAQRFLTGVREYSSTDQFIDNVFDVLDVAELALPVVGIGAGVIGKGRALRSFERQMKAAAKASSAINPDITKIAREVGNPRMAAISRAVKHNLSKITGKTEIARGVDGIEDNITSITNPSVFLNGRSPNLARDMEQELIQRVNARNELIQEVLNSPNVQRVLPERLSTIAQKVFDDEIVNSIRGLKAAVLDIGGKFTIKKDTLTNVDYMTVRLGNKQGNAFKTPEAAQAWAAKNGITDYRLGDYAGRYTVDVDYNLPETYDLLRNEEVPKLALHNTGFINSIIGLARSPKHVLSKSDTMARQVVTHGTTRLVDLYGEIARPISALDNTQRKRLSQALAYNRDYPHPITGGERGHWFEDVLEMETYWKDRFGELPSAREIDAYYAYRQLNDLDFIVRESGWYRDKARLGISKYTVKVSSTTEKKVPGVRVFQNPDGTSTKVTDPRNKDLVRTTDTRTLSFEGKEIEAIPEISFQRSNFGVAFYDGGDLQVMYSKYSPNEIRQRVKDLQAKGYKLIQAADANLRIPGKERELGVAYIVVRDFNKARVEMANVYRAGPHVVNRYPFYAKQAQITDGNAGKYIGGDTVLFGAPTQKKLNELVRNWNEAIRMMKANDPNLESFVAKNLAMDLDEFKAKFKPRKNAKGETVPGLRTDVPIAAVRSGQRSTDVAKLSDEYIDLSDNPNNLYTEIDRKFSGERDSSNMVVYEQEGDLLLRNDDGELLDPLETLSRSAYSMLNLRQKRDYFLKSTNDWASQFSDIINVKDADLARNPSRYVFSEGNELYLPGADATRVRNAEVARKAIVRFLGQLNREESTLDTLKLKIADYAYEKGGSKALGRVEAAWKLPILKDPLQFARATAFHLKLGLFNVQQLFVQASTIMNAVAISPRAGFKGFAVYPAIRSALINDSMREWAKGVAIKEGWNGDEFDEMMTLLRRSGWDRVKGDVGVIDDIADPQIFRTSSGKVLDFAATAFTEGEKASRLTAWATAYLERKVMSKSRKMTDEDMTWILDRADNLTFNMSAANNAVWQRGLVGIPLQFASWQARMTEAYFGKTLTAGEKARLFAANSALYGFPTGVGGAIGVWPVYESVKYYLEANNIDYNEGALQAVIQGIPSTFASALGLEVDLATRFGTGGVTYLRDFINGDKHPVELALGASGTAIGDMLGAAVMPAVKSLGAFINGTPDIYQYSERNMMDMIKNISTVNNATKLYYALNYGKWISKKGGVVDDVSTGEALFMALTGANLDRIENTYTKLEVLNNRREIQKETMTKVREMLQRGFLEDDPKLRQDYMQKAWALAELGGLLPRERYQILRQVLKGETQVESIQRRLEEDALRRNY